MRREAVRPRRSGGGASVRWSGVVDGAVRESEGEFAVGSEFDDPGVVVDLGVVSGADRDQVDQPSLPAPYSPP